MNIEHISVSRRGIYLECPKKYKFQYHDKIPREGEEPFYFTYGKLIHKIAEVYVQNRGEILISEVKNQILEGEIELEENVFCPALETWPKGYSKRIPGELTAIVQLLDKLGYDGEIHTEHEFYHDLDGEGRHVKGFIDFLIKKNDFWTVIDYKTTKKGPWRETQETITKNLQLRTYARMVQHDFGPIDAKKIKCAMYYVGGGNLVAAKFSQDSLEYAERELLESYKQIEQTDPEKVWGIKGDHCKKCDYNKICQQGRENIK